MDYVAWFIEWNVECGIGVGLAKDAEESWALKTGFEGAERG